MHAHCSSPAQYRMADEPRQLRWGLNRPPNPTSPAAPRSATRAGLGASLHSPNSASCACSLVRSNQLQRATAGAYNAPRRSILLALRSSLYPKLLDVRVEDRYGTARHRPSHSHQHALAALGHVQVSKIMAAVAVCADGFSRKSPHRTELLELEHGVVG